MAEKLLALDLGSKCGWALQANDGSVTSGSIMFRREKHEGEGFPFLRFRAFLSERERESDGLDIVWYESVMFGQAGFNAANLYGAYWGTLLGWCEGKKIPYRAVHTGALKKYITGKGRAEKFEVVEAIRNRGHNPREHNEADALAVLEYALGQLALEV